MPDEKYTLNCPRCGRVEGVLPVLLEEDEEAAPVADAVISQEEVLTRSGVPAVRLRCPNCGQWLKADRAAPA